MFDHVMWVPFLATHLSVLATIVNVLGGTSAFLMEVVRSARSALVFQIASSQIASSVCVHQRILVICQAQDRSRFATDPSCVELAKPLPLQVSPAKSFTTIRPLACGSKLSHHLRRLFGSEALPLCRVRSQHQVLARKYCSPNRHAFHRFPMVFAIIHAGCRWL